MKLTRAYSTLAAHSRRSADSGGRDGVAELDQAGERLLAGWLRHNEILLYLVKELPTEGFAAVPTACRGRDVARQLAHVIRVRLGWLEYHRTGKRPQLGRAGGRRPSRAQLTAGLRTSGARVETYVRACLQGKSRPRLFGKDVVRWLLYLISHESQHRGQVLLALKQSRLRLPERISIQGIWGSWIFGK
jgi:uncharacterized damage-inducible protein DinB